MKIRSKIEYNFNTKRTRNIPSWGWAAILLLSLAFASCTTKDESPAPSGENANNTLSGTLFTATIRNLPADPGGVVNTNDGHFTLFSFETGTIVGLADSATTTWDIGFRSTTIIVNGGTSGPGNASAQIVTGAFDDIKEAPSDGYKQDDNTKASAYAISTGSANGWYNYNDVTHVISSIPGRVIVVRTTNTKYVKVEILSYYKDAPVAPSSDSEARYYTFRYAYQSSGSRAFN